MRMKLALSLILLGLVDPVAAIANPFPRITVSFWEKGEVRAFFEINLIPGKTKEIHVTGNRTLAISLPEPGDPVLTVLGDDGAIQYQSPLAGGLARSLRIAACGSTIEIAGPATLRAPPACEPVDSH
jgi:hypothetical protein